MWGVIGVQVDDAIFAGTSEFLDKEEQHSIMFLSRIKRVMDKVSNRFIVVDIILEDKSLFVQQVENISGYEHIFLSSYFEAQMRVCICSIFHSSKSINAYCNTSTDHREVLSTRKTCRSRVVL